MLQDGYIHIFENNFKRQNHCINSKCRISVPRDTIYLGEGDALVWVFKQNPEFSGTGSYQKEISSSSATEPETLI